MLEVNRVVAAKALAALAQAHGADNQGRQASPLTSDR